MQPIQMVDLKNQYLKIKEDIDNAMQEVIDSTAFVKGPADKQFSQNLAQYLHASHVITCGNGTDALQIALMALGLQPGDEVITPTFTYIATVEVVALLGLKPVFVDVNPDTFTIDPAKIETAITPRTKCIVPVHLYGMCADMEPILALAKKYNIPVVEDCAQAIGSDYTFSDGHVQRAATMGSIGCFSFYPTKNLGCYGDGGALCTNDDAIAEKLRMITNHGQKVTYYFEIIGVNSRLDSLQAAILDQKLTQLDTYTQQRQEAAKLYNQAFAGHALIQTPVVAPYATHVYHQYTIRVPRRDELKKYLQEKGIPSMIYYPLAAHEQQAYLTYGYKKGDFPISETLCQEVLSLPMHTELSIDQIQYITENILNFYK